MIRLLTLSFFASVCLGDLIPVSNYIGQHKHKCDHGTTITGALVQDKIYTFGGCYPIPYMVDPRAENMYVMSSELHQNVSETIQIYDIEKDEWTLETEAKLPFPWKSAATQTYQQDIYFYRIESESQHEDTSRMWKYDTVMKEFSALGEFPFTWHGSLRSCANNGRMYFVGSRDGIQRSIVQVYNIENGVWEKPLFPNLRFLVKQMLCSENAVQFLGAVFTDNGMSYERREELKVIRTDYITGDSILIEIGASISNRYEYIIKTNHGKFYYFEMNGENTIIGVVDTVALENRKLEVLPYVVANPLFVPYQEDVFYLFGGGKSIRYFGRKPAPQVSLKKYNHKLVLKSTAESVP